MNREDYLLTVFTEELSEVIKNVCKAQRFGMHDMNPETEQLNSSAILQEFEEAVAVLEMLQDSKSITLFNPKQTSEIRQAKKNKVEKWIKYSIEKGKYNE